MSGDETGRRGGPPADVPPDPDFIKRLEDDSLWHERTRMERRADRYALSGRGKPERARPTETGRKPGKRPARRSRLLAIVILLIAAVLVLVIGLETTDSGSSAGTGPSTPFSILPLQNSLTTTSSPAGVSSTEAATTSATVTPASTPADSTTTTLSSP